MLPIGVFDEHRNVRVRGEMRRERLRAAAARRDPGERFGIRDERGYGRIRNRWDAGPCAPKAALMILTVHYIVAFLVVALGVLFVWQQLGRRVMLYALTLQIALGVWLIVQGLKAPSTHYALAIVAWIGYMAANAIWKRGRKNVAIGITVACTLMVLVAFYLGQHAVMAG
jgi:hypothetical protein